MELISIGKRYAIFKEKRRTYQVNRKVFDFIYLKIGHPIGFDTGVYNTIRYISKQLDYLKKPINAKTRAMIKKRFLKHITADKVRKFRDKKHDRQMEKLLVAIFGDKKDKTKLKKAEKTLIRLKVKEMFR